MVLEAADLREFKPYFPLEAKEGFISMVELTAMGSLTYICISSSYSSLVSPISSIWESFCRKGTASLKIKEDQTVITREREVR